MHDVRGLIANQNAMRRLVCELESAVVCALPQGFAFLPLTEALTRELRTKGTADVGPAQAPLAELFPELHALALVISEETAVSYISTEYFGGDGGQDAAAWRNRVPVFSPATQGYSREWPNSSISQALRTIGVAADAGKDEFDSLGLGNHRETHRWAAAFSKAGPEDH